MKIMPEFIISNRPGLKVLLENDVLVQIAAKYNKSTAQICVRWGIQRGLVMLPKSVTIFRKKTCLLLKD